jgi:iron complex outermembrane recepter protein
MFRYLLIFSISILFYSIPSISQTIPQVNRRGEMATLTGKITNERGDSLPGASVIIHDVKTGATSNSQGIYKLSVASAGKYLVEASYLGYTSAIQTVNISGTTQHDFVLKSTAVEQEEVTVTGVSSATRLRQNPQPVSILKREDVVNISSTNIINLISRVPGVNAVTSGPAISKPFIRGLGYNRVVTINDGVRQEGQQWGDEHGIEIDDYSAQRIEVLKGPASLIYGSDALAGVINIQTLTAAPEGTVRANVLSEYQTNNKLRGFYGNASGTKNGFSWNVYGTYKGASDYRNKYDGYVFNSKFNNKDYGAMIGYGGSWGHSYIMISNFNQKLGVVEGVRDSATGRFVRQIAGGREAIATNADFNSLSMLVPYQYIRHFKATSDNSFHLGRSRLDLIVGFQQNQRQEFGDPVNIKTPDAYFDLKTATYSARFNLPYIKNFKTSFGLTGMYQTNQNKTSNVIIPDYNLFDIGGYAFTQYSKNNLTLSGGLRLDNRHIEGKKMYQGSALKFNDFTRDFSNVSGSAGLSYEASHVLTLKANIARGFRAPNLAELASNGAHEGTNRYEVGNNNLKSEVSVQFDGGLEINTAHVSASASIYYNTIHNFLFYERVLNKRGGDSIRVDASTGNLLEVFNFNQHDAHLYGAELNVDIHPHPLDWLHFENTFSFTRAQFTEAIAGTKNVPFIPAARYLSELRGKFFTKGRTFRNLYTSVEGDYTFQQSHPFTGYNTETSTPGYLLVNAGIGGDFVSNGKTLFTISLTGSNLGDVAYQNHLSRLKYTDVNNVTGRQGVYNTGRNFTFKVNVPLEFRGK